MAETLLLKTESEVELNNNCVPNGSKRLDQPDDYEHDGVVQPLLTGKLTEFLILEFCIHAIFFRPVPDYNGVRILEVT